tara:strand:- start:49 stop:945 length:897 start_codon:yes stop_codon:yes gene_type:complete
MLKNLSYIYILSAYLISIPIEVKWSQSEEAGIIYKTIYSKATKDLNNFILSYDIEEVSYTEFYKNLKKGNNTFTKTLECTKKECLGTYFDNRLFYFKVKLNQFFISTVKRNGIDFIFNDNQSYIIDKIDLIKRNRNYAIVMDLDETVLNNSQYQVQLFRKNESFNQTSWSEWVNMEKATLLPGAKEFIDFARSQNIQIIFMSNRMNYNLQSTKSNLKALGVLQDTDIFLLRLDKADKKEVRRSEIFNSKGRMKEYPQYQVIAYFGDQYGDFPSVKNNDEWPKQYYMFPNPMYGKWARK